MKDIIRMTDEEIKKMSDSELQEMFNQTLDEIKKLCSSISNHINQLDEYKIKAETIGDIETVSELNQMLDYAKPKFHELLINGQEIINNIKVDGEKILVPNNRTLERGKSFVTTMSSDARMQKEQMQQTRDGRYEQMIEEAGPIESPISRLGK